MSEEVQTADPIKFPVNWQNLRSYDNREEFLSWMIVHLLVSKDDDPSGMSRYREFEQATDGFTNIDLKITINDIECDTGEFIEAMHHRLTDAARNAALDELRASSEFRNVRRSMRALEGAVRDRLESVARGFGLTLEESDDD